MVFLVAILLLISAVGLDAIEEGEINFTHLWVSSDGTTHLKSCQVPNLDASSNFGTTQYVRDLGGDVSPFNLIFTQQTGDNPWHPCPKTQFVVTLGGAWFVNTTDGDSVVMRAGDVLFQEDSADLGLNATHYSGSLGGPCNQFVIQVLMMYLM